MNCSRCCIPIQPIDRRNEKILIKKYFVKKNKITSCSVSGTLDVHSECYNSHTCSDCHVYKPPHPIVMEFEPPRFPINVWNIVREYLLCSVEHLDEFLRLLEAVISVKRMRKNEWQNEKWEKTLMDMIVCGFNIWKIFIRAGCSKATCWSFHKESVYFETCCCCENIKSVLAEFLQCIRDGRFKLFIQLQADSPNDTDLLSSVWSSQNALNDRIFLFRLLTQKIPQKKE